MKSLVGALTLGLLCLTSSLSLGGPTNGVTASATGTVRGRCLEITTGFVHATKLVADVTVYFRIASSTNTVMSDKDGRFEIQLPEGTYEVGWMTAKDREVAEMNRMGGYVPTPFRDGGGQKGKKLDIKRGQATERDLIVGFIKAR